MESNINLFTAFWGGFSSFFSIWQVCLLQISPFFMVFMIGFHLTCERDIIRKSAARMLVAGFAYLIGFSLTFAIFGSSSTYLSSYILYNIKVFRLISGIFIILAGLLMAGVGVFRYALPLASSRIFSFTALILGVSFAIAYSPCFPPVLSNILNFASIKENYVRGFALLSTYGTGLCTAFIITGIAFSLVVERIVEKVGRANTVIAGCALLLLILGFMVSANMIVYYKAFLLGFFVK
ncbi:MAG: hypothetical protein A2073_02530 [Deltaproteobacteria bacterium GWC2_42_11]|nr:MAG: hypothetical protein A2073_02530 [Deltaproteobacteria bacterium GWC2_42_11]HBO83585.1 hypothetical protein [Deltaproteobacteria bacterium]